MVKCEYCNSNVDESLGTCPHCGAPLPTVDTSSTTTAANIESEETSTEGSAKEAEETSSTTGSLLGELTSVLLNSRKNKPSPPRPMEGSPRHIPPDGGQRFLHDDRHCNPGRGHRPHNQERGPHR